MMSVPQIFKKVKNTQVLNALALTMSASNPETPQ